MHIQGFDKKEAPKVIAEIERHLRSYRNSVDTSKSALNDVYTIDGDNVSYITKDPSKSLLRAYKASLADVFIYASNSSKRKTNTLLSTVITLPKAVPRKDMGKFFWACCFSLCEHLGGEHIGFAIHLDETTPHIHFLTVPKVYDQKKARYKCSTKAILDKPKLTKLHQDLQKDVSRALGYDCNIVLNDGESRSLDLVSYKIKQAKENAEMWKGICEESVKSAVQTDDENAALRQEVQRLRQQLAQNRKCKEQATPFL